MELVKTIRVLVKNKVSTSLKTQGFYYVANTPDLFTKSLDKTHLIHCAMHRRKEQTPLKIELFQISRGIINHLNILS
ncbi:hypothetical protein DCS32_15380 [Dokdonia sp. Dokd-P16]|nr:hypothetical protein DCS32_15380 [Dokdonia sp. Dokd-P16]